ncbi:MAG: AIR synthase related protein [Thermodesulfobacteriota bacterium]
MDLLAEKVHFNLALKSSHFLGRKSLAVNLSDIAGIGASPRFALISLALPARISVEFADDSFCGYSEMPATYGVSPIGEVASDAADRLFISVAFWGEGKRQPRCTVCCRGTRKKLKARSAQGRRS